MRVSLYVRLGSRVSIVPFHRGPRAVWVGRLAVWRAQRGAERLYSKARRALLKYDEQLETALAFSGRGE